MIQLSLFAIKLPVKECFLGCLYYSKTVHMFSISTNYACKITKKKNQTQLVLVKMGCMCQTVDGFLVCS